jgi:hypothetical protein
VVLHCLRGGAGWQVLGDILQSPALNDKDLVSLILLILHQQALAYGTRSSTLAIWIGEGFLTNFTSRDRYKFEMEANVYFNTN